jgi:hypothetical protein
VVTHRLGAPEMGGVKVHAVKLHSQNVTGLSSSRRAALDHLNLSLGENGQAVAEALDEGRGVLPEVDGVGEPADDSVLLVLRGLDVCSSARPHPAPTLGRLIIRLGVLAVERDTDSAAPLALILLAVKRDGVGVRENDIMRNDPGLGVALDASMVWH